MVLSGACRGRGYADPDRSMLELVFAPASAKFGGKSTEEFGESETRGVTMCVHADLHMHVGNNV
jgi:hypothetical protein